MRSIRTIKGKAATNEHIFSGLACLKANTQVKNFRRFGKGKGAYVNVVSWAKSRSEFERKVERHVESLDCILVELEDVQLLEARVARDDFPEELITMRETANRQREDTVWGKFHIWLQEDAN